MNKHLLAAAVMGALTMGGNITVGMSEAEAAVVNLARPGQGQLGHVKVNPYGYAPLSAIIGLGGKSPADVKVTVKGKGKTGLPISYDVSRTQLLTHDGVPVFGLYADYNNQVELSYLLDGKQVKETYKIFTQPVVGISVDGATHGFPTVTPKKVAKGWEDRLYWINHLVPDQDSQAIMWSAGGALEWDRWPVNFITDTEGEVRWYLDHNRMHDQNVIGKRGIIMGVHQVDNGDIIFAQGQKYYRMDLMGRIITERDLPNGYVDFSHAMKELPNGHYLLRAAKKNYVRDDGVVVNTVRDHILEIDQHGRLVDVWDLNKILDPMRDSLLIALDAKAVCLNVDDSAELDIEPDAPFGDYPGVGAGRNWAHVNSIDYDASDDSIIISPRHQATAIKIGRDKQVKWILGPAEGWKGELANKLLTPTDSKGNKLDCTPQGRCADTNFDFGYTQHTSWLVPEKGTLVTFDNGDGRYHEQPALAEMKYSRGVEYKIDEQNMTVKQVWEWGKNMGYEWYSPVTSVTDYEADKDSMMMYFASAELLTPNNTKPKLVEVKYGTQDVKVEMHIESTSPKQASYRSVVIRPQQAFGQ
ncbi:aryl-sulfate sulfotransferase [Shewanella sp. NIFS-20-20]|uniref:aryl-sulfate sulfotransferase n=1 Tax=Shewanella sp. NIFS-20-20 TaxID=2853806 RepID=UPI001C49525E|nr:aryl-sulfate sulfotransferase [Shewanella sp. NIFS-20-20]MBV7317600.1 aryl-sulfate sulfotransferase [Shewanella sp. NIFS-20-20]